MKYNIIVTTLLLASVVLSGWLLIKKSDLSDLNRQLQGELTVKELDLTTAHSELHTINTKLVKQLNLNQNLSQEFKQFVKKHNLIVRSKDKAIAKLQNTATGTSGASTINSTTSYWWQDQLNRFSLTDPDIAIPNNETFTYSQHFRITGEVYQQAEGNLQTRRLQLEEITKEGELITPAALIEANFTYTLEPKPKPRLFPLGLYLTANIDCLDYYSTGIGLYLSVLKWNKLEINAEATINRHGFKLMTVLLWKINSNL